jgi:hypothetical protein
LPEEMRECRGRSAVSIQRGFYNYNKIYSNRLKINCIYIKYGGKSMIGSKDNKGVKIE